MQNVADCLADALNFQYILEAPEDGQWGVHIGKNWTGMVGMVFNNVSSPG